MNVVKTFLMSSAVLALAASVIAADIQVYSQRTEVIPVFDTLEDAQSFLECLRDPDCDKEQAAHDLTRKNAVFLAVDRCTFFYKVPENPKVKREEAPPASHDPKDIKADILKGIKPLPDLNNKEEVRAIEEEMRREGWTYNPKTETWIEPKPSPEPEILPVTIMGRVIHPESLALVPKYNNRIFWVARGNLLKN